MEVVLGERPNHQTLGRIQKVVAVEVTVSQVGLLKDHITAALPLLLPVIIQKHIVYRIFKVLPREIYRTIFPSYF